MSQLPISIEEVKKYVVSIETPNGRGTGFFISPLPGEKNPSIVTAHHVIDHAIKWREPIIIKHEYAGKATFFRSRELAIRVNASKDIAIIEIQKEGYKAPQNYISMISMQKHLKTGVHVGWLGYPSVSPNDICFFCGHVSCWLQDESAYLIDGVAINGVSGGPAFYITDAGKTIIVGLVTEYRPNLSNNIPMPGVSLVRSVNPIVELYHSIETEEQKEKQRNKEDTP